MNFDIQDMQLFLKIADTGSLTQGARERARSLSAASARLRSLEEQLGARLFYREPDGLTLTSAGEAFQVHARKIVDAYEIARKQFSSHGRSGMARLRILANAASISEIIPDLLIKLLQRDAKVHVEVHPRHARQAIKGIVEHESDAALITGQEDLCGLNSVLFATDHICVLCPHGHPLESIEHPRLADIVRFPLLGVYGSTLIEFIQEHLRAARLEAHYRVLLDSFDPIARLVEADAGVSIMPEPAAARLRSKYAVQVRRIAEPWALRERRAVFGDFDLLSPQTRDFLDILVEQYFGLPAGSARLEDMVEQAGVSAPAGLTPVAPPTPPHALSA